MDTHFSKLSIGTPTHGGFFGGLIRHNSLPSAIVWAPKDHGYIQGIWTPKHELITGADSMVSGVANTQAMAEAGSELAKWALGLRIDGADDWHLPARDVLEQAYLYFKPTGQQNYCTFRDGENPSAIPPRYGYTPDAPAQIELALFREGGEQAFEPVWHWTSSQYSAHSAWIQDFGDGVQSNDGKVNEYWARAVRLIPIR